MAAFGFVGTSGIATASMLPVEMGLAAWVLIGTLAAGAVAISLATMPPSGLLQRALHGV